MNNNILLDRGIILSSGEISKDKINLVAGAITQPFAEMVWVTTGGDMETINRLTDILVSMNTPADRGKLFKIIKMLYGLMGLQFSEEAEPLLLFISVYENRLRLQAQSHRLRLSATRKMTQVHFKQRNVWLQKNQLAAQKSIGWPWQIWDGIENGQSL